MTKIILLVLVSSGSLLLGQTEPPSSQPSEVPSEIKRLNNELKRAIEENATLSATLAERSQKIFSLTRDLQRVNEQSTKLQDEIEILQGNRKESSGPRFLEELLGTATEWRGVIKTRTDNASGVTLNIEIQHKKDDWATLTVRLRDGEPLSQLTTQKIIRFSCHIEEVSCSDRYRVLKASDGRILEVVEKGS